MIKPGTKGKQQCNGIVVETGERCKRMTFDSSGFCQLHRDQFTAETEFGILKCHNCVVTECAYRNKGEKNLCYFELYDETRGFDTKDKTLKAMREVLRAEYTLKNRLERVLSRANLDLIGTEDGEKVERLLQMYHIVSNNISMHLERFGKFMGYEANETQDETIQKKMKAVEKVLNASRKKREAAKKEAQEIEQIAKQ